MITAKVLWFDLRDGRGVAIDDNGNEYYIDDSCCPSDLKRGESITGIFHVLGGTPCLKNVQRLKGE